MNNSADQSPQTSAAHTHTWPESATPTHCPPGPDAFACPQPRHRERSPVHGDRRVPRLLGREARGPVRALRSRGLLQRLRPPGQEVPALPGERRHPDQGEMTVVQRLFWRKLRSSCWEMYWREAAAIYFCDLRGGISRCVEKGGMEITSNFPGITRGFPVRGRLHVYIWDGNAEWDFERVRLKLLLGCCADAAMILGGRLYCEESFESTLIDTGF